MISSCPQPFWLKTWATRPSADASARERERERDSERTRGEREGKRGRGEQGSEEARVHTQQER